MQNETYYESKRCRFLGFQQRQADEIYLMACGVEQCTPYHFFDASDRSGWHLHVILSGKGTLLVENREQKLHFGQMFLTKPNERCLYHPDEKDPWSYCWVTFDGNKAQSYMESAGFSDDVNVLDSFIEPKEFYRIIEKVMQHSELSLANNLMNTGLMMEFIALSIKSNYISHQVVRHQNEFGPEDYVEQAIRMIECNYDSVKISDVAKNIGLNRSYLTALFKKRVGVSPQEYLLQFRLKKSCEILLNTKLSIQEIAREVGYDNPMTFSKIFKKVYAASPREYRTQHTKGKSHAQE